jgi:predicted component of type VI protein secretion system
MEHHYFLQDAQGAYYPINGPTMIGRDLTCQIMLSDPEVSRHHALLWMERRTLYLRDENTKNGTYLDEWRMPPEKPIALSVGNQVRVGQAIFSVVSLQPAPGQPPVAVPASVSAPQSPRKLLLFLVIIIGGLCLGVLVLAVGYLLLQLR